MLKKNDSYDEVSAALDIYADETGNGITCNTDEKVEKKVDKLLDGIDLEWSLKNFVSIFVGD